MEILVIKNNQTIMNWEYKTPIQKYKNCLEEVAKKINSDTKLRKTAIFVLGSLMYCKSATVSADPLNKVNSAGNTILGICRTIGYWLVLVMCIVDILKSLMQGDTKSIAKIMMKYALAFASLYLFPWLLDLIKSIFV